MNSTRLLRILGMLVALNLVACAHEIPLASGDVAESEYSEEASEQMAEQTVDSSSATEEEQVWEEEPVDTFAIDADETVLDAQLEQVSNELSTEVAAASQPELVTIVSAPEEVTLEVEVEVYEAPVAAAREVAKEPVPEAKVVASKSKAKKATKERKNRYYVVRAGDTPEYVSMMIYKTPAKASRLVAWNGPAAEWKAGKVLYYVSPKKPSDHKVESFYEERMLEAGSVTVQEGDTLASLAQKHLGDQDSIREVALVNGLEEDEELKVGQVLKMYPSPLLGKPSVAVQAVAKVEVPKEVEAPKVEAPKVEAAPVAVVAERAPTALEKADSVRGPAIITLAPAAPESKVKESLASTIVAKLFVQHPLVLACSLIVLALFTAFFYMQRRRDF